MRNVSYPLGAKPVLQYPAVAYRDDIDGLRAIAVTAVVFFHLNMHFNHGGFLGVDVFFVISGYLITKIIRADLEENEFSIPRFYERRARRLFPALFVMLGTAAAIGYLVLLPQEFVGLGRSIAATTLFASNFYFFSQDSYFSAASDFEPLLHTWSLAVEEQFYLLFPLLLSILHRRTRGTTIAILLTLAIGSFAINTILLDRQASAAFYLPVPRAWELLLGALIALNVLPTTESRPLREVFGVVGLGAILFSVVFFSPTRFSYPIAIYACLGTALLIFAGGSSGSLVSRALGSTVPAYIGRISYSLYLWHWPVIVFYKLTIREPSGFQDDLILIVASLAIAALSAEFVEKPFRHGSLRKLSRGNIFRFAASAMVALLLFSFGVIATDGLAARFPASVARMAGYVHYGDIASMRKGTCFLLSGDSIAEECLSIDPSRRNFLLVGDSHAAHLWSGLHSAYPDINFLQATAAGCAPALDVKRFDSTCANLMNLVFRDYLPKTKLDGVILSANWADHTVAKVADLKATLTYLRRFQRNLFVVGPILEYRMALPRILAEGLLHGDPTMPIQMRTPEPFQAEGVIRDAAFEFGARYVSMIETLCPSGDCRTVDDDGAPLEFDYGHLSEEGSLFIARRWATESLFEEHPESITRTGVPSSVRR